MSISPVNAFSDLSQDMMCEIARRCDLSSAIALRGVSKGISDMVVNKSPGDHSVLIDVLKNHLNLNKPNSIIPFSITSNPLELATKLMCKGSIDVKWIPTELTGHQDYVKLVAFSPDGSQVVSGSVDKTCRVWDIKRANKDQGGDDGQPAPVQAAQDQPQELVQAIIGLL